MLPSLDRGPRLEIDVDGSHERPALRQVDVGGRFHRGDRVEVLPWSDILHMLDHAGTAEGLPFMPEMLKFCGTSSRLPNDWSERARKSKGRCGAFAMSYSSTTFAVTAQRTADVDRKHVASCGRTPGFENLATEHQTFSPNTLSILRFAPICLCFCGSSITCSVHRINSRYILVPLTLRPGVLRTRYPGKDVLPAGELVRVLSRALVLRLRCLASKRSYRFLEGNTDKDAKGKSQP